MARHPGALMRCKCGICGTVEAASGGGGHFRCAACRAACLPMFNTYCSVRGLLGGGFAGARVNRAVREGILPHPTKLRCADCRGPATQYEHRDYNKPLAVDPICRSCNCRRGPAIPLHGSIDALLARGVVPHSPKRKVAALLRLLGRPTDALADMPARLTVEHWRQLWPTPQPAAASEAA